MSGEDLKQKLKEAGYTQAEVARRLGVIPQSVIQALEAKDIKTGFLEELCKVLNVDMGFFYGKMSSVDDTDITTELERLREENARLREEIRIKTDPEQPKKESEVYRLWMEHMRITERMQDLYQQEKGRNV